MKVLGSPIGTQAFIQSFTDRRLEEERRVWNAIPSVPDLQCAWQLLLQCAGPRCHHVLRTVPPSQSARYAAGHDEGMFQTMTALLGALPGSQEQIATAHHHASNEIGRTGFAFCCTNWTGCVLGIMGRRFANAPRPSAGCDGGNPGTTERRTRGMPPRVASGEHASGKRRFRQQAQLGGAEGGGKATSPSHRRPWGMATWLAVLRVFRFRHHFRETVVLARSCASDQAHLRSHSGPGVGAVFHGSPTGPEFQVQPMHFRTLVLERLRLPLLLTEARCECGGQNDIFGRHRAACPHSGRLKRACRTHRGTLARVCREAGATVTRQRQTEGHERASLSNG